MEDLRSRQPEIEDLDSLCLFPCLVPRDRVGAAARGRPQGSSFSLLAHRRQLLPILGSGGAERCAILSSELPLTILSSLFQLSCPLFQEVFPNTPSPVLVRLAYPPCSPAACISSIRAWVVLGDCQSKSSVVSSDSAGPAVCPGHHTPPSSWRPRGMEEGTSPRCVVQPELR